MRRLSGAAQRQRPSGGGPAAAVSIVIRDEAVRRVALVCDVIPSTSRSTGRSTGRSTDESLDRLLEQSLDRSLDGLLERPLDQLLDLQLERPHGRGSC